MRDKLINKLVGTWYAIRTDPSIRRYAIRTFQLMYVYFFGVQFGCTDYCLLQTTPITSRREFRSRCLSLKTAELNLTLALSADNCSTREFGEFAAVCLQLSTGYDRTDPVTTTVQLNPNAVQYGKDEAIRQALDSRHVIVAPDISINQTTKKARVAIVYARMKWNLLTKVGRYNKNKKKVNAHYGQNMLSSYWKNTIFYWN